MATLRDIFDYQDFNPNERLSKLIVDTSNRYRISLSENELELVSAAGIPEIMGFQGDSISDDEDKDNPWINP